MSKKHLMKAGNVVLELYNNPELGDDEKLDVATKIIQLCESVGDGLANQQPKQDFKDKVVHILYSETG